MSDRASRWIFGVLFVFWMLDTAYDVTQGSVKAIYIDLLALFVTGAFAFRSFVRRRS